MTYNHKSVMLEEVIKHLRPKAGKKFIDCTLGGAGYTMALAAAVGNTGLVVSFDLDPLALENAQQEINYRQYQNIVLVNDNFKNLKTAIADRYPAEIKFDGVVFDLGLSSAQLDDTSRGFSFKGERPLNMAFGPINDKSTAEIINTYSLVELTRVFREFGEEARAYQIAKAIVNERQKKPFESTVELVELVSKVVPTRFHSKINPATKIFQALRIETNEELSALSEALVAATDLLKIGGSLVVVSFHSGEDRIVKKYFKEDKRLEVWTKRPLVADPAEASNNPRARSAKLRAAIKIDNF